MALSGQLTLPAPDMTVVAPPGPERGILGTPPDDYVTSEHFLVTWDDAGTEEIAEQTLQDLEAAWVLVDQGWAEPVSADAYLLHVKLYPLGGTGVTTEVAADAYPENVPVIYVNPDYASNTAFWSHLVAHEFAHALQFKQRDDWSSTADEAWFWEASAEWQVEQALPDLNHYAQQTAYYAWQPHFRFDSLDGSHQYGMVALTAWLDEFHWGADGLRETWEESGEGTPWLELLGDPAEIWPGFTHAYGNGLLAESSLHYEVVPTTLKDEATGTLPMLGTHYLLAQTSTHVRATRGDVLLSADEVVEGQLLAVTALEDDTRYELELYTPVEDSGDTASEDTAVFPGEKPLPSPQPACGCQGGPGGASLIAVLLGSIMARRRSL